MNLTGIKEKRIIPGKEMCREIIPYYNDQAMEVRYRDDILINTPNSAETVIKSVRGYDYDSKNNPISRSSVSTIY